MKLSLFLIFLLLTKTTSAQDSLGACIHDPSAELLQQQWMHYHELKLKRAQINISLIVKKIRMDQESLKLLLALSEVEKLMEILDELERKYLKKAFVDLRFNDMIAHPDFLRKLENKQVDNEIRTSELDFRNDAKFYELLDKVRLETSRPEVQSALEFFRNTNLGILEKDYRKSAKAALHLIRVKGATLQAVRHWMIDPPYLRNIKLPANSLGPFAIAYRSLISQSLTKFIEERAVTLAEAKRIFPKLKKEIVEEMNSITPPTESNSFDDHIAKIANQTDEKSAIEGVVRTLWGEASSCQLQGLPQFEAIGRIIADRSLAVARAQKELAQYDEKSTVVREENWTVFLKNWVGIKRPAPGLKNKPIMHLRGLSDFGRKEKSNLHPAAQVISKKGQFSVWNSYSIQKYHTAKLHRNIPEANYEIQGPQSQNDDKALVRILCPQLIGEKQKKLWIEAELIAREIVLNPENIIKKIAWPLPGEILFYTHEAGLPFAKEIKVSYLLVNNEKRNLRGTGPGACNQFRLFVSKNKNQY